MRTPRLVLTTTTVVGAFVLAGLGMVDGDAALAFAAGALAIPSAADVVRETQHREG